MEPEEGLHSFPYSETIDGIEHNYQITEHGDRNGIERDAVVIAEVAYDNHWQQRWGEPLSTALLEHICDRTSPTGRGNIRHKTN